MFARCSQDGRTIAVGVHRRVLEINANPQTGDRGPGPKHAPVLFPNDHLFTTGIVQSTEFLDRLNRAMVRTRAFVFCINGAAVRVGRDQFLTRAVRQKLTGLDSSHLAIKPCTWIRILHKVQPWAGTTDFPSPPGLP